MSYSVARIDDIEEVDDGRCPWRPVRLHLGIKSFGLNSWTAKAAGDRIINEHVEDDPGGHEELYVVTDGRATFELDGEKVDAPAGTLVFAKPGVKRTAFADEAGTTILAFGGAAGEAYEALGWEVWAPVHPLYQAGEYAAAADRGREVVARHPGYAAPLYNLACCESLAGRTDDAIDHLREAVELSPRTRDFAKGDTDLDPLRSDPRFVELFGS
ncbi:MAG TPA: tetratricopeptide repeat protein [Gaiellaceae bacterium]|nr:tetratricopeptide repeat protein [Gaiellaceae bacterium]